MLDMEFGTIHLSILIIYSGLQKYIPSYHYTCGNFEVQFCLQYSLKGDLDQQEILALISLRLLKMFSCLSSFQVCWIQVIDNKSIASSLLQVPIHFICSQTIKENVFYMAIFYHTLHIQLNLGPLCHISWNAAMLMILNTIFFIFVLLLGIIF